jgi:hypothetical protein
MQQLCEACEQADAQMVESCDDPEQPYHLCSACNHRLHARALRPREWYNLAKRHGFGNFLLHDDFYSEDGTADQSEEDVENPEDFPAPKLAEVAHDADLLLDYSVTRWSWEKEVADSWAALSPETVLRTISERFSATENHDVRATILKICACVLRNRAEGLVRYAWGDYPQKGDLWSLAEAAAGCLPFREGFERVVAAISEKEGAQKRDAASCLSNFHSPETLTWIENNIFGPITESWGNLTAASQIDWRRIEDWFERGRPLSLVAIDALLAILDPRTPLLRAYGPRLINPPLRNVFEETLREYAAKDCVPRVEKGINFLLAQTKTVLWRDEP